MITDQALIARVHRVVASRKRRHVTSADVLAVIQKESGGVPFFTGSEDLFKQNMAAAVRMTGMTEKEIRAIITFKDGPFVGKMYKFRLEPGYYAWAKSLKGSWTAEERFLLGCSFGLGQKMARYLVNGVPGAQWISFIRGFNLNLDLQVQYCAGDLEQLLAGAVDNNRPVAYTRYNEGFRRDRKTGKFIEWISDYGRIVSGFYRKYVDAHI